MGTLQKNMNKLDEYLTLPHNWNDNGALPFSKDFIFVVRGLIIELAVQPQIFPTPDSIQLEYDKDNDGYLEFELYIDRIEMFEKCCYESNKNIRKMTLPLDATLINNIVEDFYK